MIDFAGLVARGRKAKPGTNRLGLREPCRLALIVLLLVALVYNEVFGNEKADQTKEKIGTLIRFGVRYTVRRIQSPRVQYLCISA
jgi:hypothetical protein